MSAIRKRTGGAERKNATGSQRKRGRLATRETQASAAKIVEPLREGTPGKMRTRLADREKRGEIVRQPEETDLAVEDFTEPELLDSEIKLEDPDLEPLDDLDRTTSGAVIALNPGESIYSDDSDETPEPFEIRVGNDGQCWFLRPSWIRGNAITQAADEDIDETATRFSMFDALAAWLENNRPTFLKNPTPLALGVNALEEMNMGLPSVVPSAFLELSNIGVIITAAGDKTKKTKSAESYFSRYSSATSLIWTDGRLPVDFLFSHVARVAWVASAVRQFFKRERKEPIDAARISELREISIPKDATKKEALRARSVGSLPIPKFIARANQMAGNISWEEVFETHFQENTQTPWQRK